MTDEADASTLTERGLDTGLPVAGPGAPLISDFAVMELSALLGRSLDSGRNYVGQILELAYRLLKTWARVLDGQVPVWKALRIADSTRLLPADAAAFVDAQLAPYRPQRAPGPRWTGWSRLPWSGSTPKQPKNAAAKPRTTATSTPASTTSATTAPPTSPAPSTSPTPSTSNKPSPAAPSSVASSATTTPSTSAAPRHSGEIAREDLALDLEIADPETGEITRTIPGRKTELILHLSAADQTVGRLGNTRTPISVEQIKNLLGLANTSVIVRPVLDLAGCQPVDSYEIPDRHRRQVTLRDHHCVFPHCTKPAERCDLDHTVPHADGGETCPCNLAPLCRGHHRMKTADRASYRVLKPGTYLWTIGTRQYLVDPTGTHDL